jgi:omega-amidase
MPKPIDVALIQAQLHWQDAAANRSHLGELMDQSPGASLYVLPETFSTGFLGDASQPAEDMQGPTVAWMRQQAADRGAAVAGSLALAAAGARFNRFLFVTGEGVLGHYDKRHLFSHGGEDQRYRAGASHAVIEWQGWRIDLQICYDLRFPVWCRNDRQFDLQLFVANWPSPRVDAWRSLLKARAIENQSYVIGVNRSGRDGLGVDYPGCSSAWGPLGQSLLEMGAEEGCGRVTLDHDELRENRARLPFLADADRFFLD